MDETMDFTPASPTHTSSTSSHGTSLSVATADEVAVFRSIENGEFVDEGQDADDDTRSLTSSIRQHIIHGGLRYHAYHAGQYLFPNDETEQHRDNLKHLLILHLCEGAYFYAPVKELLENGAYVLDLGTGTGSWCVDMADLYPKSTFDGTDLSPIQPNWVPENVSFMVDDVEHVGGWTYKENELDFIHIRHLVHSIKDRPEMWKRVYRHLKPGGYVEVQELQYIPLCDDDSCDGPYAWRDFLGYLGQGMEALGTDLHAVQHVERELSEAGFEEIHRHDLKCPIGPWPKKLRLQEVGHLLRDTLTCGLQGLTGRPFGDGLGWTPVQIQMFLVDVRKDLLRVENGIPKFHSYFSFRSIHARKPVAG